MTVEEELRIENSMEVERIVGRVMYIKGAKHPFPGAATVDQVKAINLIKTLLLAHRGAFLKPRKALVSFTQMAWPILEPHLVEAREMTRIGNEVESLVYAILTHLGVHHLTSSRTSILLSHILEYDYAYRFRLQDLFSESSKEALMKRPVRELTRLLAINKRRDQPVIHQKFMRFAFLRYALVIPRLRTAWRKGLERCTYKNLCSSEADHYWLAMRTDYARSK